MHDGTIGVYHNLVEGRMEWWKIITSRGEDGVVWVITIEWREGWCGGRLSQVIRGKDGTVEDYHEQRGGWHGTG